jgi:hypothetical protein
MFTSILLRWRVARRLTSWGRTVLMMGNNMETIEDMPAGISALWWGWTGI